MFRIHPYSRFLKFTAVGLLLFYGLALGRSLVPELCATLSAVEGDGGASISAFSMCCAGEEGVAGQPCALCSLVCSLSEPVSYVSFALLFENYDTSNALEPLACRPQHLWSPASLRGPPSTDC